MSKVHLYIDIPYELLLKAVQMIEKKKGNSNSELCINSLVCNENMGGKNAGMAAAYCKNCLL